MEENAPDTPEERKPLLTARDGWIALFFALLGATVWGGWTAYSRIKASGEKMFGEAMATMIAESVTRYAEEHGGRFPSLPGPAKEGVDRDTDTSAAAGLVAVLRGAGPEKGKNYLESWEGSGTIPGAPSDGKFGLVEEEGGVALYNLHGRLFRVRLDTNGDGTMDNPDPEARGRLAWTSQLHTGVAVWTAGRDGDWGTWWDNEIGEGRPLPLRPSAVPPPSAAGPGGAAPAPPATPGAGPVDIPAPR